MDEQGYKEIFRFHKFPFLRTGLIGTSSTRGHRRTLPKGNRVLLEAGEDPESIIRGSGCPGVPAQLRNLMTHLELSRGEVNISPGNRCFRLVGKSKYCWGYLPLGVRAARLSRQIWAFRDAIPGRARKPSNFHRLSALGGLDTSFTAVHFPENHEFQQPQQIQSVMAIQGIWTPLDTIHLRPRPDYLIIPIKSIHNGKLDTFEKCPNVSKSV